MQKSIKKELKMPIKRGEIYLFVGFEAEKFCPQAFWLAWGFGDIIL